jgi:[ribosomal protein S5]-alanine N-acetyltransferase
VTLRLVAFPADADAGTLARRLAPGYGGDVAKAEAAIADSIAVLTRDPRPAPWGSYLAEADGATVGICAFKAAPDAAGRVEIAYHTFPAFERRGYAKAMAGALFDIACAAGAARVIAHTLPAVSASTYALVGNGFSMTGEVVDPEDGLVWRWERDAA